MDRFAGLRCQWLPDRHRGAYVQLEDRCEQAFGNAITFEFADAGNLYPRRVIPESQHGCVQVRFVGELDHPGKHVAANIGNLKFRIFLEQLSFTAGAAGSDNGTARQILYAKPGPKTSMKLSRRR